MKICVTGGAGYVGSVLVPSLLNFGHEVTVLDTFWFGDSLPKHSRLHKIVGDIRNDITLNRAFTGQDAVIHLACVSNDPSFDMNPKLGEDINYIAFKSILTKLQQNEVKRFIYASSSSVYGVSELEKVTEETEKKPLTDYSKYKLACEVMLKSFAADFSWTILRPATVCGYSPRQRLDLVVNILTSQAVTKKEISIHGGTQYRPNIHINDMVKAYITLLDAPKDRVNQKTYNVGFENLTLNQIGRLVEEIVGKTKVEVVPTNDERSYRINSDFIQNDLGFYPSFSIGEAISDLKEAIQKKRVKVKDSNNYNIKKMKELEL